MRTLVLGVVVLSLASCGQGSNMMMNAPTSREIRGQAPTSLQGQMLSRVVAINADTRQVAAQAMVDANGNFVLPNVPTGATYRLHAIYGRESVPITFTTSRNGITNQRVNTFSVGVNRNGIAAPLSGPIDLAMMRAVGTGDSIEPPAANAPDLQEDWDNDGVPDGRDPDWDGDGTPNAMDTDQKNDGTTDREQYGDLDGDGLTNESDPDLDGDGMPNTVDTDNDNDGTPDTMDMTPGGTMPAPNDCDGDGLPDSEDETPCGQDIPMEPEPDGGVGEDTGPSEDAGMDPDL